jgi:hypothetical protein
LIVRWRAVIPTKINNTESTTTAESPTKKPVLRAASLACAWAIPVSWTRLKIPPL